jgi:DNA-binding LacI/PurR family transcriptional regulator
MQPLARLTLSEQTEIHLREGFRTGRWVRKLPGVERLAEELDVSPPTIRSAILQLETKGLLVSRGKGRSREIVKSSSISKGLRVCILPHDPPMNHHVQTDNLVHQIRSDLEAVGHVSFFAQKSQVELQHDVGRITNHITENPADAWIVSAGSYKLLEWFAEESIPCMALYGRKGDHRIASAGPDKLPAFKAATRSLIDLGHRRITLITLSPRRKPSPGRCERAFLEELESNGIKTGDFNLPDWEETPEGFLNLLEALFRTTPPTAMIIEEEPRLIAAMQFLLQRGIKVPEEVSLVSTDYESLTWCHLGIAHMRWNSAAVSKRILRWASAVSKGKTDRKKIYTPAKFISGGSIGPAQKKPKS